jgi:hypothetical protein
MGPIMCENSMQGVVTFESFTSHPMLSYLSLLIVGKEPIQSYRECDSKEHKLARHVFASKREKVIVA